MCITLIKETLIFSLDKSKLSIKDRSGLTSHSASSKTRASQKIVFFYRIFAFKEKRRRSFQVIFHNMLLATFIKIPIGKFRGT